MKVTIAGDYCPRERVAIAIERGDYSMIFGEVKEITCESDYSIVNLECPVVETPSQKINKCGPSLKCTGKGVSALKWAGFDCVTLANNHFLDYGETGVTQTLASCHSNGLDTVGGGINIEKASKTLFKTINGNRLAIINCCEHEFSIADENHAGSNPLNVTNQYYAIIEAKKKSDYAVVIVHGGVEHFWLPTNRMIETYRFFIEVGADAVVNHHQHCFSGYEIYKNKPIFYGLGNFSFDGIGSGDRWSSGYIVTLNFSGTEVEFDLIPYKQCNADNIGISLLQRDEQKLFKNIIQEYNNIISDPTRNKTEYLLWCDKTMGPYQSVINPLYNRFTKLFFDSFLGRKIITKQKLLHTKDILINESHIERLRLLVDKSLKNY